MIRLRQIALVAADLDDTVDQVSSQFGLEVCFNDPGVAEFGLRNALFAIGDQFLEVVSPIEESTTAGRLLDKRGDGGYMAIFEVDDLDERIAGLTDADVRIVWSGDFGNIRGRHLHPHDVGGTLVSLDEPVPPGSWRWAGPEWTARHGPTVAAIAGATIGTTDPAATRRRWDALHLVSSIDFIPASERGEGLDAVDLVAVDRQRIGEKFEVCGVSFRFV